MRKHFPSHYVIHPEVLHALKKGFAIVALETTVVTHGLPYPFNVETALASEEAIRAEGATPCTIALIDGQINIGLGQDQIELLGKKSIPDLKKISSRDLPFAITKNQSGGTTVSATMACAEMAGIGIMATGGIGGVHRGWQENLDISADIFEFSRKRVAVVCSGAKSLLDLGATLEVLETLSVPVVGFQTDHFPAFYCASSKHKLEHRIDSVEEAAQFLKNHWTLFMHQGALIANPVPKGASVDETFFEEMLQKTLREAAAQKITGQEVTPFLLKHLNSSTDDAFLKANCSLIINNARLAAQIAIAFAGQRRS